jgi:hypothetical protein
LKLVLDPHVVDRLEVDAEAADLLTQLIVDGKVVVLMPRVFQDQLSARSSGMPDWLPIHEIPDAIAKADVLVSDDARCRSHAQASGQFEALMYEEFVELLKLLRLPH